MSCPAVRDRGREWATLLVLMLAYAALFAVYYPPLSGIEDEVGFVNQALVWSHGAISPEGAGLPPELMDFIEVKGRHVAVRNPGRSLLALPFLMVGGARATFASGLLLHLAVAGLGGVVVERLGRSPLWAVLLLFHPTLAIYSRTIMGDEAAGAGLLLTALALTSASAWAGLWAGLAVGLAAVMRYQAGLALPFVAAAFRFPPGRPHPGRDALLCLLAGGTGGGLIVAYNLFLYNRPTEAFSNRLELFTLAHLVDQIPFFSVAFLLIWPAMLLAPVLDRSRLRWLVRGTCATYLVMFSLHHFHDQTPNWLETLVIGPRLFQVVLPLWIVSYAGVVDDWVASPLRRLLGSRAWAVLVAAVCAGLLAGTGLMFSRHQAYLNDLHDVRDAAIAAVPEGSLIVLNNMMAKLFGIPMDLPSYRCRLLDYQGQPFDYSQEIGREQRPWYLGVLPKVPGSPLPDPALALIDQYQMTQVPTSAPRLMLYVARPAGPR
jgi:hypothetical protein